MLTDGSIPEETAVLPPGASLQALPGWLPVGFDEAQGRFVVLEVFEVDGKRFRPRAVGAVLPPGWTPQRPPSRQAIAPGSHPAAVGLHRGGVSQRQVCGCCPADRASDALEPNPLLDPRLDETVWPKPGPVYRPNRVLRQLETCALSYRCFTAQNVFYGRDEGALPTSTTCNARCVGCISEQPKGAPPSSHTRMDEAPLWSELAEVGGAHLRNASGRVMVSFGQGCEGEPLTRAPEMEKAIRALRAATSRGSIHINTNASLTAGLDRIARAGLDSVRVSLNSAHRELYEAYYLPQGYDFTDVDRSLRLARKRRLYVALNLLTFPGITDREGAEVVTRSRRLDRQASRRPATDSAVGD